MNKEVLDEYLEEYCREAERIGLHPIARVAKVFSALHLMNALAGVFADLERDPYPVLIRALQHQIQHLKDIVLLDPVLDLNASPSYEAEKDSAHATEMLFELAWTIYDQPTYEHSVLLIEKRLRANGLDEQFFAGRKCFDGGCGTGRFAVAMARMGAQVIAMDMGGKSLEFAKEMTKRLNIEGIEYTRGDVTSLGVFGDGVFDFVVSNGVLHHALETEKGITEHLRITKSGGLFWLYLYGAGGLYWPSYDCLARSLKAIDPNEIRDLLYRFGVRKGAIYTFMDNLCAPIRKYYTRSTICQLLADSASVEVRNLRGISASDDVEIMLATRWGREVMGPDGEVRLLIVKSEN